MATGNRQKAEQAEGLRLKAAGPPRSSPSRLQTPVFVVADRIYQRDPHLFNKLVVWVHDARKRNWSEARIHRALLALEKKLAAGETVDDWWPYLNRALAWLRTRDLEKENDGYKHGDLTSARAIMKKLFSDL